MLIISLFENPFFISYLPAFIFKKYFVLYAALKKVTESLRKGVICFLKLVNPDPDLTYKQTDSSSKFVFS